LKLAAKLNKKRMHLQLCCIFRYYSYKSIYSELQVIQHQSASTTEKLALTGTPRGLKGAAIPKRLEDDGQGRSHVSGEDMKQG
jgi:hypothetical protein